MSADLPSIPISLFKATCLAVLERVRRTGRPILVTRRGVPIAEVVPATPRVSRSSWLGTLQGRARIVGDVVAPAGEEGDWETLRP